MENKAHFGSLTDRMSAFREEVLDEKPYIDAERALLATQAYKENQNHPPCHGESAYAEEDFGKHDDLH